MSCNFREGELFKIALWSIRRLPTKQYKLTALKELLKEFMVHETEYGIVEDYIKQVEKNGGF